MSIEQIDYDLCNGCGICIDSCPCDVIRLDTLVAKREEYAPCRFACPAGVNMRRYNYLLQWDMLDEAVEVFGEFLPLPAITGRVCPHPCESECARKDVDEAVSINSLERFVGDYWLKQKPQPQKSIYSAKVAIIGSGPAGLSSSYFLVRMGYPVTIFESMPWPGGMLRIGIPEFLLPRDVLDAQINYLTNMGIEIRTSITFGNDLTLEDLKRQGYQAVLLAIGNRISNKVDIEGAKLSGVLWGLDFLKDVNLKQEVDLKDTVLVIGGGDVAVEVASTAIRLGAKKVKLAFLESEAEMPAHKENVKQAVEDGIAMDESWGIKRVIGDKGKVTGAELVRCLSVFDKDGNFNPCFAEKEIKTVETDTIVFAIGQTADFSAMPKELKTKGSIIQVDPITLETNLPGVFAGGDVVISGAKSVIQAIASGKRAAVSIDRFLRAEDLKHSRVELRIKVKDPPQSNIEKRIRQTTPRLAPDSRIKNFAEIKGGFSEEVAVKEARRCMTCGSRAVITYAEDCMLCEMCAFDCPRNAIRVSPQKTVPLMLSWG